MKWKIWPRQYGKTYAISQWWVEDPANRVILVENTTLARMRRDECRDLLAESFPDNTDRMNRLLVRNRIYSWRTWRNSQRTRDQKACDVAIDGLDAILPQLFQGNIVYGTGVGQNDIPNPEVLAGVEKFNEQLRAAGVYWDE